MFLSGWVKKALGQLLSNKEGERPIGLKQFGSLSNDDLLNQLARPIQSGSRFNASLYQHYSGPQAQFDIGFYKRAVSKAAPSFIQTPPPDYSIQRFQVQPSPYRGYVKGF